MTCNEMSHCINAQDCKVIPKLEFSQVEANTRIFLHSAQSVCKATIRVHSFTGCDSVSTFAGLEKLNALKLMMEDAEIQDTFGGLGREWIVPNHTRDNHLPLIFVKTPETMFEDLCYGLFAVKKG